MMKSHLVDFLYSASIKNQDSYSPPLTLERVHDLLDYIHKWAIQIHWPPKAIVIVMTHPSDCFLRANVLEHIKCFHHFEYLLLLRYPSSYYQSLCSLTCSPIHRITKLGFSINRKSQPVDRVCTIVVVLYWKALTNQIPSKIKLFSKDKWACICIIVISISFCYNII